MFKSLCVREGVSVKEREREKMMYHNEHWIKSVCVREREREKVKWVKNLGIKVCLLGVTIVSS